MKYSFAQRIIYKFMKKISFGRVLIIADGQTDEFVGSVNQDLGSVTIVVHNKKIFTKVLIAGTTGAADSFIQGHWETDDLAKLIQIIIANENVFKKVDSKLTLFMQNIINLFAVLRRNNKNTAKKNTLMHYDLGNEFFSLFLDKKMMYSCALYPAEVIDLDAAATYKLRTICDALQLTPEDHLLEIGSGWGGLSFFAAQEYGCKVTTTTISDKQYAYVKGEIERRGLQSQINILNEDYRDLKGQYDKLVSIEMIEAVGAKFFKTFFTKCDALVKPGGLFFLQAITINDGSYESARKNIDFIKKYIFSGGCLPSLSVINKAIATNTQMQLVNCYDIGSHYVKTLQDWMAKFLDSIAEIKALGFSDQFIRTWYFYFCYCIAGFQHAYISDIHALWQKGESST
jgi:cyclopropane-fatty-acyl-phospholipid synthase